MAAKHRYTVNDAAAFGVTGFEYYTKFILPVGHDRIDGSNLSSGPDTLTTIDTLFLKSIASGKNLTLYNYSDNLKNRFFIANKGAAPAELIYRVFTDPEEPEKTLKQFSYRRQLQQLAAIYQPDNKKLLDDILNADYNQNDLQKIVVALNGGGSTYNQLTYTSQGATRLFAGIGINNTSTKISGSSEFSGSKSYTFPQLNLGADFLLNKNIGTLIIRAELNLTENKASFTNTGMAVTAYTSYLSFNQLTADVNPQLLYNIYNTNSTKIYVAAGLLINFSAYSNKTYTRTYAISSADNQVSLAFPDVQPVFFDGTIKAGFVLNNKFSFYAGYAPSAHISDDVSSSISESFISAGFNYLFDSK